MQKGEQGSVSWLFCGCLFVAEIFTSDFALYSLLSLHGRHDMYSIKQLSMNKKNFIGSKNT